MQNFKKQVVANTNLKDILSESKKSSIFINGFDVRGRKTHKWHQFILIYFLFFDRILSELCLNYLENQVDPFINFLHKIQVSCKTYLLFVFVDNDQKFILFDHIVDDSRNFYYLTFIFFSSIAIKIPILELSLPHSFVLATNIDLFLLFLFSLRILFQIYYFGLIKEELLFFKYYSFYMFSFKVVNPSYVSRKWLYRLWFNLFLRLIFLNLRITAKWHLISFCIVLVMRGR
jgi:hypothetical protein